MLSSLGVESTSQWTRPRIACETQHGMENPTQPKNKGENRTNVMIFHVIFQMDGLLQVQFLIRYKHRNSRSRRIMIRDQVVNPLSVLFHLNRTVEDSKL